MGFRTLRRCLLTALSAALFSPATAAAQSSPTPHAQVELLAQQASIVPGSSALLGVHFRLERGWHIYWQNPGDSGQPPSLVWKLPPGFTAGAMRWPAPGRILDSPDIVDYGYQDEVMLLMPLRAPAKLSSGAAHIAAHAKWLICREVCIPEHENLALEVGITSPAKPNPATAALFKKFKARLPRPAPRGWGITAISRADAFILPFPGKLRAANTAHFFPLHPGQIENAAPQKFQSRGKNMSALLLKQSEVLQKPITRLEGVLETGAGQAFIISAPVRAR